MEHLFRHTYITIIKLFKPSGVECPHLATQTENKKKHMLRKYILYIIIGVSLIACDRQSHPGAPEAVEQAIGMVPTSVAATRALISDTEGLQREGFIVYGYKETTSNGIQVFDHQAVNYSNRWTYTPTRYWDRAAAYYFGAFSPQTLDANHQGTGKDTHTILIDAPHWQVIDGSEADIIVATSHDEAESYLELHGGEVDLHFEHILSQLEVQLACSSFLTHEHRLHTLSYRNVPAAEGVATYHLDYTDPSRAAMGEVDMATNALTIANSDEGIVINPEGKEIVSFKQLVVPFQTDKPEGIEIDVDYSVNGKKRNTTVATQLQVLEAGKRYVLRLTFSSNGIDIVPTIQINEWVDEEMDEDDKYNW